MKEQNDSDVFKETVDQYFEAHQAKKDAEGLEKEWRQRIITALPILKTYNGSMNLTGDRHKIIAKRESKFKINEEVCRTSMIINEALDAGKLPEVKRTFTLTLDAAGFGEVCNILKAAGRGDLIDSAEMHYDLPIKDYSISGYLETMKERIGVDAEYFIEDVGVLRFYPVKD